MTAQVADFSPWSSAALLQKPAEVEEEAVRLRSEFAEARDQQAATSEILRIMHGSWLNIAEIELSILSRQCLDRCIPDRETLEREVAAWQAERNALGGPVNWRFTTDDARINLKRLYPSIDV